MASPTKITYDYSFLDHTVNEPDAPQPGGQLDEAFAEVKRASDETIDRLNLLQRDDGGLGRVVGPDQLQEPLFTEFENLADAAEQSAQNAAASEAAAAQSETNAAGSATAAHASEQASSASQQASAQSEQAAAASAANASASEGNAATSASNAAASEQAAATSATVASDSAQASQTSRLASEDAASIAENSQNAALASEQAAAASATLAQGHANDASDSADQAASIFANMNGGTTGQFLIKRSNDAYDYSWTDLPGGGDMLKSVYDTNDDGIVDEAAHAQTVPWVGISDKPAFGSAALEDTGAFAPAVHDHDERYYTRDEIDALLQSYAKLANPTFTGNVRVEGDIVATGDVEGFQT